ncbi:APO protein 4, mitochondrial-like protein [Drosera capensis]
MAITLRHHCLRFLTVTSPLIQHFYSTAATNKSTKKPDLKKLRPMILRRIQNRSKEYPIKAMIPVARDVLRNRDVVINGVSVLLRAIPVVACKFCPEVYIGERGHAIRTCRGYKHRKKNQLHQWIGGTINDVLPPVEAFHLNNMFQSEIKHEQRFDYERIPAVVELCWQAGADPSEQNPQPDNWIGKLAEVASDEAASLTTEDFRSVAIETMNAWEEYRKGVDRLLLAYPSKVCAYCSEVHIGPSGHRARLCGVFKYETWRGGHFWKKAGVDDVVPPKIVWHSRPQDPPELCNEGRDFYGHAPAVVDLCSKAGAFPPKEYFTMMKIHGLPAPVAIDITS